MDRLERDVAIVDEHGNPTHQMQRKWQETVDTLVDAITVLGDAITAIESA